MWNIEGKALGTVLGEFKDRFNCNSRAKKLVTDWSRVVLLEASNTSTKMGLIVKDCAAHVIDVEALDATAGDIVHLQAEEDILCDIFSGRYNPASLQQLAIVFGVLALIHPLWGTMLGIYTLWVLAPAESAADYSEIAA